MRRILAASLLSCLALTAAAATPKPATDAKTAAGVPVSTGITEAQLFYPTAIHVSGDSDLDALPNPAKMLLKVNLDATGSPTNVQVVQSINPSLDARVVKAVRQFRWRPAVLDNQTISSDVNLTVEVQH
jgi:TonB family protein